jgi:sterol desaturase/sphingolipid hydroxylase (fatty acid hydroxylase superfamily)
MSSASPIPAGYAEAVPSLSVFDLIAGALVGGAVVLCFAAERRRPLRRAVRPLRERLRINVTLVTIASLVLRLVMIPTALAVATAAEAAGLGLLRWLPLPGMAAAVLGILLLDWTLYLWHRLNHRVPELWRFHLVHHTDLDLDVSTAFRFHAGELLLAVGWRALQIVAVGASPGQLLAYEIAMQAATAFHHSNWRLPARLDRALTRVLVTPRMHGIHHSVVETETNSNWSVIFAWWDRLHGTLRLDVPNETLTIGLPAWRDPRELTAPRLLALPFQRQRPAWAEP